MERAVATNNATSAVADSTTSSLLVVCRAPSDQSGPDTAMAMLVIGCMWIKSTTVTTTVIASLITTH